MQLLPISLLAHRICSSFGSSDPSCMSRIRQLNRNSSGTDREETRTHTGSYSPSWNGSWSSVRHWVCISLSELWLKGSVVSTWPGPGPSSPTVSSYGAGKTPQHCVWHPRFLHQLFTLAFSDIWHLSYCEGCVDVLAWCLIDWMKLESRLVSYSNFVSSSFFPLTDFFDIYVQGCKQSFPDVRATLGSGQLDADSAHISVELPGISV